MSSQQLRSVSCPQPYADARSQPCAASCGASGAVLQPPPVLITFPGPVLSSCPQDSIVGSAFPPGMGNSFASCQPGASFGGWNSSSCYPRNSASCYPPNSSPCYPPNPSPCYPPNPSPCYPPNSYPRPPRPAEPDKGSPEEQTQQKTEQIRKF